MNKLCIQIVLFLLTISLYVNNKTLATEPAPIKYVAFKPRKCYLTSEEIYEKNKHLLCTDPEETVKADEVMNEAVKHLEHHSANIDDYKFWVVNPYYRTFFYKKKDKNLTDVLKVKFKIDDSDKYNEIINMLWDPDRHIFSNSDFVKIVRVYNPNLVMIQQRYKKKFGRLQRYFYALATKVELSENKTIVVMASANINDHNLSIEVYQNTIIKSANLFKTDIDSEDDIRKGELKKTFINIAGYLIEKKDGYSDITYIESFNRHAFIPLKRMLRKALCCFLPHK
ncbi:fam-a protein [Plasmodium berghei]|uniref:Fam-a protein n=2 Tax=Plasmodium berghei TaxID=5821 RepID=A0A509AHH2_PLABA|nr:fam-a protein [Plasmodium berghei ANKA]CXI22325.1 fam-a protein [Plasmodium berghei]SBW38272.1 fam-a protein [Plasmodium berghei]SCL86033.1 fam-a protein [Plasmodium berghei]VUC54929.1 fam-a protein [Plasmodium berghei ANKA]|eukprot:XP_034420749.1 fam-a protein [Plasmodium berghei ANKA]